MQVVGRTVAKEKRLIDLFRSRRVLRAVSVRRSVAASRLRVDLVVAEGVAVAVVMRH